MMGTTLMTDNVISPIPASWEICATGDYNQDGNVDIVWRNISTGEVDFWFMDGLNVASASNDAYIISDLNWRIQAPR